MPRTLLLIVVLAVVIAACGGQPETCDEVADETIELAQDVIDEVEATVGDANVEQLGELDADELGSVEKYRERATELSEVAGELGCSEAQWQAAVSDRAHRLEATTPVGELIIWAIENGRL